MPPGPHGPGGFPLLNGVTRRAWIVSVTVRVLDLSVAPVDHEFCSDSLAEIATGIDRILLGVEEAACPRGVVPLHGPLTPVGNNMVFLSFHPVSPSFHRLALVREPHPKISLHRLSAESGPTKMHNALYSKA